MVLGPYDFPQVGDSIRIVTALAVGSISFEQSIDLFTDSDNYLADLRSGRDSLFAAVSRAKNAFYHPSTGWDFSLSKGSAIDLNITDPPPAPSVRYTSDSSHVRISWEDLSQVIDYDSGIQDWAGYRVYRRVLPLFDLSDPTATIYEIIYESTPLDTATFYDDYDVVLGQSYWYNVTAFDASGLESHPALNRSIPGGAGRETEQGAGPFLPAMSQWGEVVVVPNPYHIYAARLGGTLNTISFFNLPYSCRLRVYSQTGDLVKTILKEPGVSNVQEWNQISDANQYIVSGLYIYVVDQAQDDYGRRLGGEYIGKFVVIR